MRAAIDLTPHWMQKILQLDGRGLHRWEAELVRRAGAFADRLVLESSPAVQACRRMWLPAEYLYVSEIGVHQQAARDSPAICVGWQQNAKSIASKEMVADGVSVTPLRITSCRSSRIAVIPRQLNDEAKLDSVPAT